MGVPLTSFYAKEFSQNTRIGPVGNPDPKVCFSCSKYLLVLIHVFVPHPAAAAYEPGSQYITSAVPRLFFRLRGDKAENRWPSRRSVEEANLTSEGKTPETLLGL